MIAIDIVKDYSFEGISNASVNDLYLTLTNRDLIQQWWENPVMGSGRTDGTLYFLFDETGDYTTVHVDSADRECGVMWSIVNDTGYNPEWIGTKLQFRWNALDENKSRFQFAHVGLNSNMRTFEDSVSMWEHYMRKLIRVSEQRSL